MRIFEVLFCIAILTLFFDIFFQIGLQIYTYQTESLMYMEKTKDVLVRHGTIIQKKDEKNESKYDNSN